MEDKYYNGVKILSTLDLDGLRPEIYMVSTNRTGGKTTFFGRMFVNRFLKKGKKFMLEYRYKYELDDVSDKFYKDIGDLFFPNTIMTHKNCNGVYTELFINDIPCGYAVCLNAADQIKKISHMFSDVDAILFDEFQPENNKYLPDEIKKFISIHTSVARGHGKHVRYVPVFMLSNPVTIINPYFTSFGVSARLKSDTKILRGHGWVLEQGYVESAAIAQKQSGFNRAFQNNDNEYLNYQSEGIYLLDNKVFIDNPVGKKRYYITLKYKKNHFGVWEYPDAGIMYVEPKYDKTFPIQLAVTTDDMDINFVSLKENSMVVTQLRYFFNVGCFRFRTLQCKEALMAALTYI